MATQQQLDNLAKAREAKKAKDAKKAMGSKRRERKPLDGMNLKLKANIPNGYVGRWVNDSGDRVNELYERGYEFVNDTGEIVTDNQDIGTRVSKIVNPSDGKRAYLMVQPEEYYKEDQATKQETVNEIDAAIRGGALAQKDSDQRYVPEGGIKIG